MQTKTLNYTKAQLDAAVQQVLDSQVSPEQIFLFIGDFSSSTDTTVVEGIKIGTYARSLESQ